MVALAAHGQIALKSLLYQVVQAIFELLKAYAVDHIAHKGLHEQHAGMVERHATGAHVEEGFFVELANGRAM